MPDLEEGRKEEREGGTGGGMEGGRKSWPAGCLILLMRVVLINSELSAQI